jgi:hypothetical protein
MLWVSWMLPLLLYEVARRLLEPRLARTSGRLASPAPLA